MSTSGPVPVSDAPEPWKDDLNRRRLDDCERKCLSPAYSQYRTKARVPYRRGNTRGRYGEGVRSEAGMPFLSGRRDDRGPQPSSELQGILCHGRKLQSFAGHR